MEHRIDKLFNRAVFGLLVIVLSAILQGCDKDDEPAPTKPPDRTRIGYIVEDNFNFSLCHVMLNFTGQSDLLKEEKPYTLLAPDNNAFGLLRVNSVPHYQYPNSFFVNMAKNAVLPGAHRLKELPLGNNHPILSANGHPVYVNRYLLNGDTITRVNGVKVLTADIKASNGYLQATEELVQAERSNNIPQYLLTDTSLTLFALAMQHSGLMTSLQSNEYTLLAPVNQVLRSTGAISPGLNLSTPENILASNPTELASLLKYHMLSGRQFLDQIYRLAAASGDNSITTLNGGKITVGGNSEGYNMITFLGNNNSSAGGIYKFLSEGYNLANFPAGNGVVHNINKILIP